MIQSVASPGRRLERTASVEVPSMLGLPDGVVAAARESVSSGRAVFLVLSGPMGAGKDTVAPLVMKALGRDCSLHLYYADALKAEVDEMLDVIRGTETMAVAACRLQEKFDVSAEHAVILASSVRRELDSHPGLHARSRTPGIRTFLQVLGTDVRRAADPDYWVRMTLRSAAKELAVGRSVHLTDARFPNEIDAAVHLGAFAVRLDVSPGTQAARLAARDGRRAAPRTLEHPSESALDGFSGYSCIVQNDGPPMDAVDAIVAAWHELGVATAQ